MTPTRLPRLLSLLLLSLATTAMAADRQQFHTKDYRLSISPRSPQQIAAFYEGRGFPAKAVQLLKKQCYFTMGFHNTSDDILWLDLSNWKFTTPRGVLKRLDQGYWKQRWHEEGLATRYRSTFHWTLAPERRDFQPDEGAGGNIILPYTSAPIRVDAKLKRVSREGKVRIETIRLEGLRCAR